MPITVRGSLQVPARVENLGDLLNAQRGLCKPELVRAIDVPDALIAPATSCFALPARQGETTRRGGDQRVRHVNRSHEFRLAQAALSVEQVAEVLNASRHLEAAADGDG